MPESGLHSILTMIGHRHNTRLRKEHLRLRILRLRILRLRISQILRLRKEETARRAASRASNLKRREERDLRLTAFTMALHARLGDGANVANLGSDIFRHIVTMPSHFLLF
jgi:hypothetical protein